jgi:serine/threonine protein kinase
MEKMNGGTLQGLIDRTAGPIDEETTHSIIQDVLSGLHMIHEKSYIHRDLKPENILLNVISESGDYSIGGAKKKYIAKIADFGLSAEIRYGIYSGLN